MGCHTWFFRPITNNEIAKDTCDYSIYKYKSNRYTDIDTPHDIFRIGGYPNIYLLSKIETFKFIDDNIENISFSVSDWKYRISCFWDKHPNGVIEFG